MLHDCIDFIKACKMNFGQNNLNDSNEEVAFMCTNSLEIKKFLKYNNHDIVNNINKSSMSLS